MSKNAAILFARSKQDFRTVEKTDVDGMLNIYEGHLWDTVKKRQKRRIRIVGIPKKKSKIQVKAPSVERYFVMLGRCNIRRGFEARGPCILSRTYCWILLKSSLLLHVYLLLQCRVYMPHAHGESNRSLLCCTYVLNFKVSALIAAYKDIQRTPF